MKNATSPMTLIACAMLQIERAKTMAFLNIIAAEFQPSPSPYTPYAGPMGPFPFQPQWGNVPMPSAVHLQRKETLSENDLKELHLSYQSDLTRVLEILFNTEVTKLNQLLAQERVLTKGKRLQLKDLVQSIVDYADQKLTLAMSPSAWNSPAHQYVPVPPGGFKQDDEGNEDDEGSRQMPGFNTVHPAYVCPQPFLQQGPWGQVPFAPLANRVTVPLGGAQRREMTMAELTTIESILIRVFATMAKNDEGAAKEHYLITPRW